MSWLLFLLLIRDNQGNLQKKEFIIAFSTRRFRFLNIMAGSRQKAGRHAGRQSAKQ